MLGLLYALTVGQQGTASEPPAHRTLLVFCSSLLGVDSCSAFLHILPSSLGLLLSFLWPGTKSLCLLMPSAFDA